MMEKQRRPRLVVGVGLVIGAILVLSLLGGSAAAQTTTTNQTLNDTAPYYENGSSDVDWGDWVPGGQANVSNLGDLLGRIGPAIIGVGVNDPSGTGTQGYLLTGLAVAGGVGAATIGAGVGPVGGLSIGLTLAYGLSALGLAPPWIRAVTVFVVGLIVARAFRRALA